MENNFQKTVPWMLFIFILCLLILGTIVVGTTIVAEIKVTVETKEASKKEQEELQKLIKDKEKINLELAEINKTKEELENQIATKEASKTVVTGEIDELTAKKEALSKEADKLAKQKSDDDKKITEVTTAYNGQKLSASNGTVMGPNGKETYYNLDMSGVISNAQAQGINGNYWVREDGAKMYGSNIILAANLTIHPRGSLVETSLGTGIVLDTGGFAVNNPNQIDIATNW